MDVDLTTDRPSVNVNLFFIFRKSMQRNKQMAMGRKKFNMDPKKVSVNPQALSVDDDHVVAVLKQLFNGCK